jgi:PPOX class probable F420-dependent enzyme
MSRREQIRMIEAEIQSFLDEQRTMAVATIGRDGFPHVVAMWYTLVDGKPAFWTYAKSQKALNLRRDLRVTCLVETGEAYGELRGVQIKGRATLIEDAADVLRLGEAIWERYTGGPLDDAMRQMVAAQARKRVGVIVEPVEVVTWDHRKLGGAY